MWHYATIDCGALNGLLESPCFGLKLWRYATINCAKLEVRKIEREKIREVEKLFRQGNSPEEVAAMIGVNRGTLINKLAQSGFSVRKGWVLVDNVPAIEQERQQVAA